MAEGRRWISEDSLREVLRTVDRLRDVAAEEKEAFKKKLAFHAEVSPEPPDDLLHWSPSFPRSEVVAVYGAVIVAFFVAGLLIQWCSRRTSDGEDEAENVRDQRSD